MALPWASIITLGVVPLAQWAIEFAAKRRDKRKKEEAERAAELERQRLKAQTYKAIQDAKENYQDIDPSKYET